MLHLEKEGSPIIDRLISKTCKDLLERGLLHPILFDVHLVLVRLDQTEEEANRLIFFWHSQFVEVADLFKDFDLGEQPRHQINKFESIDLHVQELHQGRHSHLPSVMLSFLLQI